MSAHFPSRVSPGPDSSATSRRSLPPRLGRLEAPLLAALGALQTLACVHTWAWWLPVLTTAALVWGLNGSPPRRAAWLGWCYGTGWLVAAVWWLYISLHSFGGLPAPLAALAVLALAAALSLYLALAAWLYARLRRGQPWLDALLFTALFVLVEWARGVIFTGFPWAALGYTQVDAPLAALAPWVGVYGLGAIVAWSGALLAGLPQLRPGRRLVVAALLVGILTLPGLAGPWNFTTGTGTLRVALLQTNVRQDEKFSAERLPETLAWVARELQAADADLVVTPETAVPLLPYQLSDAAPGYWDALVAHFKASGRAALVGVPLGDFELGYTNSAVGLTAAGAGYRYDKQHLVPFGEFVPTGFRWFTEMMNIPLGDFSRGVLAAPSFAVGAQRVAPNICYEDLFGEELALRFRQPHAAPTVLANISNIAWFGDSVAIAQHRNISRLRTLELQRPMIRATNTGATVAIDHRGRVLAELPPATLGVLTATVEGRVGNTPFVWWAARFGLWPLVALAVLLVLVLGLSRPARRPPP